MGKFSPSLRTQDAAVLLALVEGQPQSMNSLIRRYSAKRSRKAIAMSIGRLRAAGFPVESETHYTLKGSNELREFLRKLKT